MPRNPFDLPLETEETYKARKATAKKLYKRPPKKATPSFWREKEAREKRQASIKARVELRRSKEKEAREKAQVAKEARRAKAQAAQEASEAKVRAKAAARYEKQQAAAIALGERIRKAREKEERKGTQGDWEEVLRKKGASKEAKRAAEASLKREEREKVSKVAIGVSKEVARVARHPKGIPGEIKKYGKELGKGARSRALGTLKRVGLEAPGYIVEKAPSAAEGALSGVTETTTGILKGLKKIRFKMPKGIRHPDSLINPDTKFLYLPDRPALSPIGRVITNPMELYFAKTPKGVPFGSMAVFAAIKSGFTSDQLGVVTSLTPPQVDRAIAYLKTKGLLEEDYE